MQRVVIHVCGIFTEPGDTANWTSRAVTWTHLHRPDHRAESFEYFSTTLSRRAVSGYRGKKLAKKISFYLSEGWTVDLVAHSNGANIVRLALEELGWPELGQVSFISPACPEDCDENGINMMRAEKIRIHIGTSDLAMVVADTFIGRALGFDDLGRKGPQNVKTSVPIEVVRHEGWGHSTAFNEENFHDVMSVVVPATSREASGPLSTLRRMLG